jgi:flagellar hook-associated protein 1
MNSLLAIGSSAVRAYQGALATVSSNIANAGVEGYARREAILATGPVAGQGWPLMRPQSVGTGVSVEGVRRAYDEFLAADARAASAQLAQFDVSQTWSTRLQTAFGSNDNNIATSLTAFFNAATEVSATPDSTAARLQFLDQARGLASGFRATALAIDDVSSGVTQDIAAATTQANALLSSLYDINHAMRRAAPGSDLLAGLTDRRDTLLNDLSRIASIHVTEQTMGTIEVRLGDKSGPLLMDLAEASALATEAENGDVRTFVVRQGQRTQTFAARTGTLAGLSDSFQTVFVEHKRLDELAQNFVRAVNAQHQSGTDWRGMPGVVLFSITGPDLVMGPGNRGQIVAEVQLAGAATPVAGYVATYQASNSQWTFARADNSASVSGTSPLVLDGVTLTVGGTPRDGDALSLQVSASARHLATQIDDPQSVAAAPFWQTTRALANSGTAVASVTRDMSVGVPLASAYRFTVVAPGIVDVSDASSNIVLAQIPYNDGQSIAGNGFSLTLSAGAQVGDSFTVQQTPASSRSNDNMQALARLRLPEAQGFEQTAAAQRTRVSQHVQAARLGRSGAETLEADSIRARDAVTGVNLDEEAADLVRLQQAYQASARILSTAQTIFDSLLNAT